MCVRSYPCVGIPPYQCFGISMSCEPIRSRSRLLPLGDSRFAFDVVSAISNNGVLMLELIRHGLCERCQFTFGNMMSHVKHLLDWLLTSMNLVVSMSVFLTYPPTMLSQPQEVRSGRLRPDSARVISMSGFVWSSRFGQRHLGFVNSNMIQCGGEHLCCLQCHFDCMNICKVLGGRSRIRVRDEDVHGFTQSIDAHKHCDNRSIDILLHARRDEGANPPSQTDSFGFGCWVKYPTQAIITSLDSYRGRSGERVQVPI
jgi:hypothetical protein